METHGAGRWASPLASSSHPAGSPPPGGRAMPIYDPDALRCTNCRRDLSAEKRWHVAADGTVRCIACARHYQPPRRRRDERPAD